MYCRRCGNQIPDDSVFCSACGEKLSQAENSAPNQQISNTVRAFTSIKNIRSMRIASLICSIIILLSSFTKWVQISLPRYDYMNYSKSTCSTVGLYNTIQRLEEMGAVDDVLWIAIVLIAVNLLVIVSIIVYLIKEWFSDPYERGNENIILGCTVMNILLVILVICVIGFFIINQVIDPVAISFTGSTYVILVLAAVNRFFILPKYNEIYYYNSETLSSSWDENERQRSEKSKILYDKKLLDNNGWLCNGCGKVNPQYTGTCSCGKTKYENQ